MVGEELLRVAQGSILGLVTIVQDRQFGNWKQQVHSDLWYSSALSAPIGGLL